MIKLNADESMLLLIAKGHEHKEVQKNKGEGDFDYIKRVCAYRCGCEERYVDLFANYKNLALKLLTVSELLEKMEYLTPTRHTYTLTPNEAIICALMFVKVKDCVELDYSYIKEN